MVQNVRASPCPVLQKRYMLALGEIHKTLSCIGCTPVLAKASQYKRYQNEVFNLLHQSGTRGCILNCCRDNTSINNFCESELSAINGFNVDLIIYAITYPDSGYLGMGRGHYCILTQKPQSMAQLKSTPLFTNTLELPKGCEKHNATTCKSIIFVLTD